MSKIRGVALKLNGNVHVGQTHISIIKRLQESGEKDALSGEQGFVTSEGNFLNKKDAGKVAVESGQVKKLKYPPFLSIDDLVK